MARYRLGNEMKGKRYWEGGERRICRICVWGEENWMHVLEGCNGGVEDGTGWQEKVQKILKGDGRDLKWMEMGSRREKKKGR